MSEATGKTVLDLIAKAAEGDSQSVDELLHKYRPYLSIIAENSMRQMFQNKFDASDIVQKTCLDAFNGMEDFRGGSSAEFNAWITRILRRNIAGQIRTHTAQRRDVRKELPLLSDRGEATIQWHVDKRSATGPESIFLKGEVALLLADALSRLDEEERTAVQLRFLEGCKLVDIAEQMKTTTTVVARLIARGVHSLRQHLPSELQDIE